MICRRMHLVLMLALTAIVLSGCAALVDSEASRICRSALPALNPNDSRFNIRSINEANSTSQRRSTIMIDYQARSPQERSQARSLTCSFAAATQSALIADLDDVVTENGSIGAIRLHLLKRHWLGSALAATADPAPLLTVGPMPELPRALAITAQQLLAALPSTAVYGLLAAAYSLIYGLIGRINLAFGELAIVAAYAAFLGFSMIGHPYLVAAVATATLLGITTGLINGFALGRWVLQPLVRVHGDKAVQKAGQNTGQHVLIATIGFSIAASELVRLVQGTGARWMAPLNNRPIAIARSGDFPVTITVTALIVAIVAVSAAVATVLVLTRSRFGRHWRATADDADAAAVLGIDPTDVLIKTVLLASLLTGLSGALMTLYYGGAGYSGGLLMGLKALIGAILGGIGSVPGALIGGLLLGVFEALWSAAFRIEYRDAALFTILAVVLAVRPQGILGIDNSNQRRE